MSRCGEHTSSERVASYCHKTVGSRKILNHVLPVKLAIEFVYFWNFCFKFFTITFRQTSHHVHLFQLSRCFVFHQIQYLIDAFFFGVTNETTSVDYSYVAVQLLWIMVKVAANSCKLAKEVLGVYKIL